MCSSISLLVQDLFERSSIMKFIIRSTLTAGNLYYMLSKSRIMPKYSRHVPGPSNLFSLRGTFKHLNLYVIVEKVHSPSALGWSVVKKSSNMCKIQWML